MNLLVTGRANINRRAKVRPIALIAALGFLTGNEVMFGEFGAGAIAKLTGIHKFWKRDVA